MNDHQTPDPWERQTWESVGAYNRFLDYYLSLPSSERSLCTAYNNYRRVLCHDVAAGASLVHDAPASLLVGVGREPRVCVVVVVDR